MASPSSLAERKMRRAGVALVTPAVAVILLISIIPLIVAGYFSLTKFDMINKPQWVGLENYHRLFGDEAFWEAATNTFYFAFGQVVVGVVVALMVAMLFSQALKGGAAMRTVVYIPQAASYVVISLIWTFLFDPAIGPINAALNGLGIDTIYFLTDQNWAMPSIMVMSLWRNLGYFMVILLAGIQAIPTSINEAAHVDGANAFQRFFLVTIPQLKSTLLFVFVTWFLGAMQMFTQSYVMTQGGPINATRTLVYRMYDSAFTELNIGAASSIAVLLFLAVVLASLLLKLGQKLFSRQELSTP